VTPRERLLTAIDKGKPDRMPASLHQWQPYHLQTYMNGMSDLEAFEAVGLDAQIQYFPDMAELIPGGSADRFSTPEWRDVPVVTSADPDARRTHHTIYTPGGELTYILEGDRKTTWKTEYPIKRDEDLEIIERYMPAPPLDVAQVRRQYDAVGDAGILRGFVWGDQAGPWQHATCLMDINDLILKAIDDPGWVHRLLRALLDRKLRFIESMAAAPFDLVETGGGAGSSTVISPDLHAEFCLPYDREMHDALRRQGFRVTYHTCGGTLGIEEHIVANGCDCSETLAPKSIGGNQEPWEFAAKIAGRVALIGGMDQFNVITDGPVERIRRKTFELFEKAGRNGGFVCSLSDHFFDAPREHLIAFGQACRECAY
jgi:uroporphyrinogen-III decarboxylase